MDPRMYAAARTAAIPMGAVTLTDDGQCFLSKRRRTTYILSIVAITRPPRLRAAQKPSSYSSPPPLYTRELIDV